MSATAGGFTDFVENKSFGTKQELNDHLSASKRGHKIHAPCDSCGVQLHITAPLRVNRKTGVPKVFCEACKSDLIADMGGL